MPITTRTFRVFVSSTFEDLKQERDALQREVFPQLRKLCEQHGARFQPIDLRWGVRDQAALDQQTMEICLREIRRCCPDLVVETVQLGGGEFNDVLVVNKTLIFRFPRSVDGVKRLQVELAALGAIQGHVSLRVPDPTFVGENMQTPGRAFLGYREKSEEYRKGFLFFLEGGS